MQLHQAAGKGQPQSTVGSVLVGIQLNEALEHPALVGFRDAWPLVIHANHA